MTTNEAPIDTPPTRREWLALTVLSIGLGVIVLDGTIVGVGAMEYPAEFQGASDERLANMGISKIITLTSTYDHRIIQGAESGDFLRTIHQLLLDDEFYDEIFRELGIPYEPVRWRIDNPAAGGGVIPDIVVHDADTVRFGNLAHGYEEVSYE